MSKRHGTLYSTTSIYSLSEFRLADYFLQTMTGTTTCAPTTISGAQWVRSPLLWFLKTCYILYRRFPILTPINRSINQSINWSMAQVSSSEWRDDWLHCNSSSSTTGSRCSLWQTCSFIHACYHLPRIFVCHLCVCLTLFPADMARIGE